jgi:ABC-type bacteriocin/lantibiotic exporter with double-glycine peptidase domain
MAINNIPTGLGKPIFNNRSILILDESTSSLDTTTEKEFINTIKEMKNKKTIIIISHRESVFEFCDKLYFYVSKFNKKNKQ